MKKLLTTATLITTGFISVNLLADEAKQPYIIQREDGNLIVNNMPQQKTSEPITVGFVYISGEYIEPPYIVSVSNLAICINGRVIQNDEPLVRKREFYAPFNRVGITPESVAEEVDSSYESWVGYFQKGSVTKFAREGGGSYACIGNRNGDGEALSYIELAKKAKQGDEKAREELTRAFTLGGMFTLDFHPDWVERLATNTNLEARATAILEAKKKP